jgi:hypothetical protein
MTGMEMKMSNGKHTWKTSIGWLIFWESPHRGLSQKINPDSIHK